MRPFFLLLCLLLAPPVLAQEAHTYHFDTEHTYIGFSIRHIGVIPVEGRFTEFEGAFHFDPTNLAASSLHVTVQAESIDTKNARRDRHLRSGDFFEVETYPTLTFVSDRITRDGDQFAATGTLTIHGVSKTVTLPFTLTEELLYPNTNSIFRGTESEITINRVDYGVGSAQAFRQLMANGSAWASEEVKLTLNVMWERNIPHLADTLVETIRAEGTEAGWQQFRQMKAAHQGGMTYSFSTNAFSKAAQAFLEAGNPAAAVALHEMTLDLQPDWWWLLGSLAEAYAANGQRAEAIATYERLLDANPEDAEARAQLEALRAG